MGSLVFQFTFVSTSGADLCCRLHQTKRINVQLCAYVVRPYVASVLLDLGNIWCELSQPLNTQRATAAGAAPSFPPVSLPSSLQPTGSLSLRVRAEK